jgi:uncharacterized protein YajQ (UPF0234 family)
MPSFDIVSRVDLQEIDNATNNVKKEIATRYDFRNVTTEIDLNRKDKRLHLVTGDEMKMNALRELLITHCVRRKVDPKALEFKEMEPTSKGAVKMDVEIKEGVNKEVAQTIVKKVKDLKLKVQTSIQDEQVRVTGKKIDELQAVIQLLQQEELGIPLQYVNMKS